MGASVCWGGLKIHRPGCVWVHDEPEHDSGGDTMTVRPVWLDAGDAVELGELLVFVSGWLDSEGDLLAGSFRRFVGSDGYPIGGLRADLARFAFLLGGGDGEVLCGGGER